MTMAKSIFNRLDAEQETEKDKLLRRKRQEAANIQKMHEGNDLASILKKQTEMQQLEKLHEEQLKMLRERAMMATEIELYAWKDKLEQEQELIRGKRFHR